MSRLGALAGSTLILAGCFVSSVGEGEGGTEPIGAGPAQGGAAATGGEATGAGPVGGNPPGPFCGDGHLDTGEACDPGATADPGCVACAVEPGFTCQGEPSTCAPIEPIVVDVDLSAAPLVMVDSSNFYDGTIATMDCVTIDVATTASAVQWATLDVAMEHTYVGDLVVKLVPPAGAPVATLMSRPGYLESADTYEPGNGASANLVATSPVRFDDAAQVLSENMGAGLGGLEIVCEADGVCTFASSSGAVGDAGLGVLKGAAPAGTWRACFGDGDNGDQGKIFGVRLIVLAW